MILNTDLDLKLKFWILKIKLFGWIDTLEIRRKLGENMRLLAAAPAPKKCIDRPLSAKEKEKIAYVESSLFSYVNFSSYPCTP